MAKAWKSLIQDENVPLRLEKEEKGTIFFTVCGAKYSPLYD